MLKRFALSPTFTTSRAAVLQARCRPFNFHRMASTLPKLPVFEAIASHDSKSIAVVHSDSGRSFTYGDLIHDVAVGKHKLAAAAEQKSLEGQRIAFLIENGYDYVVTFLAILASHGIALPLSPTFPAHEIQYILDQSEASVLLSSSKLQDKADEIVKTGLQYKPILAQVDKITTNNANNENVTLEDEPDDKGGLMLYTSGTTSRPKGVLLPSSVLSAQAQSLHQAWKYSAQDRLLHVLPLHHIHGTMNALMTPLFAGSTIEFMFPFNPNAVWERLASPYLSSNDTRKDKITFFTVVPTIYSRLLKSHSDLSPELQKATKEAISPSNLRLNISGSAALPTPTKDAWTKLSGGNVLLERYGMTEVGMALSCGLDYKDRVDGSVGWPLPLVEARLVDTETNQEIKEGEELDKDGKERHGEIQLRGPTIFKEYWKNAEATASEFVEAEDGRERWFKTGDVAVRRDVKGAGQSGQDWAKGSMYFIQGRKSADIIKTGGEKVSALEIEREMLSLSQISECAVVPLESEAWGQKVAAVVVLTDEGKTAGKGGKPWGVMDMRRALKEKLANYKIPQELKVVDSIPRNAMGKVNKKNLVKEIFGS